MKVAAVGSELDAGEDDLLSAAGDGAADAAYDIGQWKATGGATRDRRLAERALVVAAVLGLDEGARPHM